MNLRPVGDTRHGYGTRTARQTLQRLRQLGVNTIGFLVEGRMATLESDDIEGPTRAERDALLHGLIDANALGFATVLVPHLVLGDGQWRGLIRFDATDERARWERRANWWRAYGRFIDQVTDIAATSGTTVLSLGVELKGLSADPGTRDEMDSIAKRARQTFDGLLTYNANWDEAEAVGFWDVVDVAGVNGYYPLLPEPERGAETIARRLAALGRQAKREVLVLEVGFRSSPLSHVRPWEWPSDVKPIVDDQAQARALAAVLAHWLPVPEVRGVLIWVVPTDPDDPASEPRHGFNPMNKPAETVIQRAFTAPISRSRSS